MDSLQLAKQLDSLKNSNLKGLDVSATVNINKAAKFTIVVDERNGDVVKLQGEAHLNGGIDASGKTNLTGTIQLKKDLTILLTLPLNGTLTSKKAVPSPGQATQPAPTSI